MGEQPDNIGRGGYPQYPDLPDGVSALYVSTKNTWQDAENLDDTHGYNSYVWIPEETFEVRILKLHVYAEKFRAYSKGASSGGGQVITSQFGSNHQHRVASVTAWVSDYTKRKISVLDGGGTMRAGNIEFQVAPVSGWMTSLEGGSGAHTHGVSLPNHTHDIDFGIYEEAITDRTLSAVLYDPDDEEVHDFGVILTGENDVTLDLSEYFDTLKYGMYRLELSASDRLRARLVFYELCVMYAA